MRTMLSYCALIAATGYAGLPVTVPAQTYPVKPIRIIVGFSAGGSSDWVSRITAAKLNKWAKVIKAAQIPLQ